MMADFSPAVCRTEGSEKILTCLKGEKKNNSEPGIGYQINPEGRIKA